MELNHLKVFFEVAKIGRFSEAARQLNISQSALSRSVALLEESEGVQLFVRSKRGVSLTPIGEEVFLRCEQLFKAVEDIEGLCRGQQDNCEGLLRFATTDHVTNDLLVKPLQAFRRLHPLVVPSIFTGTPDNIVQHLLKTDCEFALMFSKVRLPTLKYHVLRDEPMALVCQKKLWQKYHSNKASNALRKVLKEVGYIASIGATLQTRPSRVLSELFGEMPKIGFEANSQETQKRICVEGGGIAYLARFMVEKEINDGILQEVRVPQVHSFKLWVATIKGKSLSYTAQRFLESMTVLS